MPRKKRFFIPGVPVHIVQRGNNRNPIFFEPEDYRYYLDRLDIAAKRYGCQIHAYVLMTNHVHLLASPGDKDSISQMMQHIGRHYVPYINLKYDRSGTLWEGRFRSHLVQDETYLLNCMRYIELNPVRAGLAKTVHDYRWSSHHNNTGDYARGQSGLISYHSVFLLLGREKCSRIEAYKNLFQSAESTGTIKAIRTALQSGTPLGDSQFKESIEETLSVTVGKTRRGRPKKKGSDPFY